MSGKPANVWYLNVSCGFMSCLAMNTRWIDSQPFYEKVISMLRV